MPSLNCDFKQCFLCTHCLPEWKSLIAVNKQTIGFKKGKKIFEEGDPVKGIYFMYEGSVKVSMKWEDQKELIIRFARSGDVLGYRGFGGEPVYPVSATALEEGKVCFIDNQFLESTLHTNAGFTYQMMQLYASELQKAEKRLRDLAHREVKGRIALALFELSTVFGTDQNEYITVPVTRQDIASFAGTTYETVFKFFTELTQRNILSTAGKSLRINDHKALQAFI